MSYNISEKELNSVSPVTLSADWSRVARLLLLASLAAIGSIGNVFMISAVMIEDYLRKRGNAFLVNVALADFMVSGLLVPTSAVVILAGLRDNLAVCRFQWFLAVLCFLVTVLSITTISIENWLRLCCTPTAYEQMTRARITWTLLSIWVICSITSGLQFKKDLSFDYCTRKYPGLIQYQASIGCLFVVLPVSLTCGCYIRTKVKLAAMKNMKLPATHSADLALMLANFYSFLLFIVCWLPFGVVFVIEAFRPLPDRLFYNLAWFAISKSCINSLLYCAANRHFRAAYVNLFHYCCCKTSVSFTRQQRQLQQLQQPNTRTDYCSSGGGASNICPSGDVRVHIIPGYNIYTSPMRGVGGGGGGGSGGGGGVHSSSGRHSYEQKRSMNRSHYGGGGRDVYEL